jgi:hypothetical protein
LGLVAVRITVTVNFLSPGFVAAEILSRLAASDLLLHSGKLRLAQTLWTTPFSAGDELN